MKPAAFAALSALAAAWVLSGTSPVHAAPDEAPPLLSPSIDFTLPNGMKVFLVRDTEVPLLEFEMRLAGGSCEDPSGTEGIASVLAAVLSKGAGSRDAQQFREDMEFVGGVIDVSAAQRFVGVSAEFLKKDADLALELLSDVVQRPRLDVNEFVRERDLAKAGLDRARQEPQAVLPNYWSSWMFAGHPFARPASGEETSLAKLTIADLQAAAKRQLSPARAWLAVGGDFDPADMRKKLEARFGEWKTDPSSTMCPAIPLVPTAKAGRVLLVDAPDAYQTYFRFGNLGFDWSDKDYAARYVANTILGGRFTSRLNQRLRTELGLTYGANSGWDDARRGMFQVNTYTAVPTTEKAMSEADAIYRKYVAEGLTQKEFESARAYIRGQYATNSVETAGQRAGMILALEFDGVSRDVVNGLFARLDALTLADVNRVIKERFPKELAWVVVGPAETVRDIAKKYGTVTEVKITDAGWGPR